MSASTIARAHRAAQAPILCGKLCRQASWRFQVEAAGASADGPPMRFAYFDPCYPGKAHLYPEHKEVDHAKLIVRACWKYPDGWALSTSSEALPQIIRLCPIDARVCIWIRMARKVKSARAIDSWEPLIVWRGRPLSTAVAQDLTNVLETFEEETSPVDRVDASLPPAADASLGAAWTPPPEVLIARGRFRAFPGAMVGMKPPAFSEWMFRHLGARAGDRLDDIFPGSGAVTRAWQRYVGPGDASPVDRETARPSPRGRGDATVEVSPGSHATDEVRASRTGSPVRDADGSSRSSTPDDGSEVAA